MDRQSCKIETSFMAAMDRFSLELRTLFQERMPITSSATPPRAGQRSQERERFELYGESRSLDASCRTQALGQSQPTWVNPGPTLPEKRARGPLHALAMSLGQSSRTCSAVQQIGPVRTVAVQQPLPTQLESPPQDPRTEDVRGTTKDGLAQRRPGAPGDTEPYPPGKSRTWRDLLPKAFWARRTSKHSAMGTSPYVLTYGHNIDKLMEVEVRFLRVFKRLRRKTKSYAQIVPRSLENLEQSRFDAYNSAQVQEKMAPRAYDKKVKKKKRGK
ncbi:unnamed protein product [Prunus brigantina]